MPASNALLQELEIAVSRGTAENRLAALSYATDLLVTGRYTEDELWTFGDVVGLLASEIESAARAQLSGRLAECRHAPVNLIRTLAFDDSIEVAGPVLRHSDQLTVERLVENARIKSQDHLLAISQRKTLHPDVTDVIVSRGDQAVVRSVASNNGARFSDSGFWQLVRRSENDVILSAAVGVRRDISRHHFQKLIAKASDEAKTKLAAANPNAAADIQDVVTNVTGAIQEKFGPATRSYFAAKRSIGAMYRAGELTEAAIADFAKLRKFEEVTVALSQLCDLPVNVAERALLDHHGEMTLILAKATKLSWTTARLVLLMCAGDAGISAHDLDKDLKNYSLLSVTTAREVMGFYRARQASSATAPSTLPALHAV